MSDKDILEVLLVLAMLVLVYCQLTDFLESLSRHIEGK
jgi:hypothetical protein